MTTPRQNVYALRAFPVVHALKINVLIGCWDLIPSFALRCLSLLLWISRHRGKKKGPQIHKRYVDDNLLQLLILKLFVGPFTKYSSMVAITNYGAWCCFLTHQIHVRQPSFHFVQQTGQFSACQKLCSSDVWQW